MLPQPALADATAVAKHCRNCGADATGEYCAVCGQETRVKLPTARVFLREATGRYVALDGRLWRTLAALLFRPGFLTREYFHGRRRRYIRPARLFLVLSLAFFAAIRFFGSAPMFLEDEPAAKGDSRTAARQDAKGVPKPAAKSGDGDDVGDIQMPGFHIQIDRDLNLDVATSKSPILRELQKRFDHFNSLDRKEKSEQIFFGSVRYGPYAMFVLMPALALLMMVAYLGRGRRYPDRPRRYAEHLVFSAHTHAFVFVIGVLALSIPFNPLRVVLGTWCMMYVLWATKVVYRGGWFGLLLRALFVSIFYLTAYALVVAGLVLVAILVR
jgi:hypothetical protein